MCAYVIKYKKEIMKKSFGIEKPDLVEKKVDDIIINLLLNC